MNKTLDDTTELHKLDKYIYEIPDDIKRKIYEEYFEPTIQAEELCNQLLEKLTTENSYQLSTKDILPFIEKILQNKIAISHLRKINSTFSILYKQIIIEKKRNFILLLPSNDIAMSWLCYLYH
jgi:hypothetical protein